MIYKEKIEILKSTNQNLKLKSISNWLKENKTELEEAINNTTCHKWKKWQKNKSLHIFPCLSKLCGTRNEECRFIEFYKKLIHYIETIRPEEFYENQLKIYEKIKHNKKAVFEWIIDIKQFGKELTSINEKISFPDKNDNDEISLELYKISLETFGILKKFLNKIIIPMNLRFMLKKPIKE